MKKVSAKKVFAVVCTASILTAAFSGCSSKSKSNGTSASTGNVTISVSTNAVGDQATVLKNIAQQFEKENPTIKVNFTAPGADYENIMKVKMASNQMPDVFATHGWAKARYGKFLYDLKNESWTSNISSNMKQFVTDDSGKVYVLPMDADVTGINYNVDILKKYNISIPTTWDEFVTACDTIRTKSNGTITPIHIGGGDSWTQGQYFDFFAAPAFETDSSNKAQFTNSTFDWTKFTVLPQNLLTLWKKGDINKDYLTSKYEDSATQMASGKVAFTFYGPSFESEITAKNPNANIGMMPIPSLKSGDKPSFVGGEKTTWGVWKDSKNIKAAVKFVNYYAKEENIQKVCKSSGLPSGLSGVTVDDGKLTSYFTQYKDTTVYPYFDREYLPDGMWDVMTTNAGNMISGSITPSQYSENMKTQFTRLKKQSK